MDNLIDHNILIQNTNKKYKTMELFKWIKGFINKPSKMTFKDLFDKIAEPYTPPPISLEDCPISQPYFLQIVELLRAITNAMGDLKKYITVNDYDYIISSLWTRCVDDADILKDEIGKKKLSVSLKTCNIHTIKDVVDRDINTFDNKDKDIALTIKRSKQNLDNVISYSFITINNIWTTIGILNGGNNGNNPTIQQIYNWAHDNTPIPPYSTISFPRWNDLCEDIKPCICNEKWWSTERFVLVIFIFLILLYVGIGTFVFSEKILLNVIGCLDEVATYVFIFVITSLFIAFVYGIFYLYIRCQSLQCEKQTKLKEKMMDNIVAAFNEDREYYMLRTKTEISLHEKREKARIEQWERNREHEREIFKREQERKSKLSEMLIELAKVHNKETRKCSIKNDIISETSILSRLFN